ncbi:MAG TPA: hypothetical protein VGD40_12050 [Chryseosolibacter sp.]
MLYFITFADFHPMRVIKEIPHPLCKITLFAWNNRYIIKVERGLFEQTFKIPEFDVTGENEVVQLIDEEFVRQCVARFEQMAVSLAQAQQRVA